ncbi:MAG: hypothetical protein LUH15_02980 [Tannerellaceae bacterium]|nr:hypothetical protein [Tannerellaceae bacterium]
MKSIKSIIFILLLAVCYIFSAAENKPYGLLTDLVEHTGCTWNNGYASNVPVWNMEEAIESLQYVKIGSAYPTFSWIVPGNAHATYQTFCRIIVADNMDDATMGKGNIWDSGMVESNKSTAVLFGGDALQPEKKLFLAGKDCYKHWWRKRMVGY